MYLSINYLKKILILFLLASVCSIICYAENQKAQKTKTAERKRIYQGDRYRDPFIPLAGSGIPVQILSSTGKSTFDPNSLTLKGIISTKTGRIAMLKQTNGARYMIKDGKIFDNKNKSVKGFAGIVKEKSIVIIDSEKKVTELKLRKPKEGSGWINIETMKK